MLRFSAALAPYRLRIPRINRLGWLMGLYAENFRRMEHLFAVSELMEAHYHSSIGDGLDLCLKVIERAPWTTRLCLSYADLNDPVTGQPEPSAWLRLYHDSRQLEATHCYLGHGWQDVVGLRPQAAVLADHRLHMNTFLGKWLQYLGERGHHHASLHTISVPATSSTPPKPKNSL